MSVGKSVKATSRINGKISRLLMLAAALALIFPSAAGAYVYSFTPDSGIRQRWNTGDLGDFPIPYWIHDAGSIDGAGMDQIKDALDGSFKAWENIPSADISFDPKGLTSITDVNKKGGDDGVNLIIFDTQTSNFTVSTDAGPSVVAITINKFSLNGHLVDSDIIFNDREYVFSTTRSTDLASKRINLQDVATHEIGHLLGLGHSWIEQATMYPYTRDGQRTPAEDDRAGISNLYPVPAFDTSFDSLTGYIENADGAKVSGIYVSAIDDSTEFEAVAALSDTGGFYNIRGLRPGKKYYLRARTVELKHVGKYINNNADTTVYIPQYYSGASSIYAAEPIITGGYQPDYDFTLTTATLLARYDMDSAPTTLLNFGSSTTSNYYMAVRFPVSILPDAFKVHGMTFFNNDLNMAWPRIMLTGGSDTAPEINSPIRQVVNYEGPEQSVTNVEWEAVQLTRARTLWVVFQFPDKKFQGLGDGPALGADSTQNDSFNDTFISKDGGASFSLYRDSRYDLKVYLTVEITDAAIVPSLALDLDKIDFGRVKAGWPTVLSYPLGNTGQAALELFSMEISAVRYTATVGGIPPPATIEPGQTDSLTITFEPTRAATYSGELKIVTNDQARGELNIPVTGTGVFPVALLSTAAVAFDTVEAGSADTLVFSIASTGEMPLLAWGWSIDGGGFSVLTADTLEIPPADSADVQVRFAPLNGGAHSATLSFTTDDAVPPTVRQVTLTGTASGDALPRCDMTGDGRVDIVDLLYFLLLSRRSPDDPRLDWDGSGGFSMADVLALLMDIRLGTCPDVQSGAVLAALEGRSGDDQWLETLSAQEIAWLRERLKMLGLSGKDLADAMAVLDEAGGGGGGKSMLPAAFSLAQNRPNPFNPSTAISYSVPQRAGAAAVSLKIYNISGRLVRVLAQGPATPGEHTVYWDGADQRGREVSSGVYIYRLQAGGKALTRKMVLLK